MTALKTALAERSAVETPFTPSTDVPKSNVQEAIDYVAANSGGVTDGDKGDITVSGAGATWTIDSNVISTFGRTLTDDADAATARGTLGLGTMAVETAANYLTTAAAASGYQPLDGDLTSWAGVTRASGFDTFATTPSSANLRSLLSDESGTGAAYFQGGDLGTPSAGVLTNATGLPVATGISGLGTGVATALAVNVGASGAPVVNGGALGTPSSGTLTNCTGLPTAGIVDNAVSNAKLADMATATFKGRTTAGTGDPEDLSATQATALLNAFVGDSGSGGTKGLVPAPASGDSGKYLKGDGTWATLAGGGDALTTNPLSQFASTTSAQLAGVISDETGSGALVFATSPTLVTPALGTPSSGTLTNCTGLPLSGVVDSTSEALGVGTLEVGHASDTTLSRASAGVLAVEGVQLLKANGNQTVTGGFAVTPFNDGTVSSGTNTPAPADGNYQYYTNNGAHTLAAPSSDCAIDILVTNGASAGAITFSGFTVGSATGSALTTTNAQRFLISIRRINSVSTYSIYALQ